MCVCVRACVCVLFFLVFFFFFCGGGLCSGQDLAGRRL